MSTKENTTADFAVTTVYADGSKRRGSLTLLREHHFRVYLGEKMLYDIPCTDTDLKELAVGRLFSDGYIRSAEEIEKIEIDGDRGTVLLSPRPLGWGEPSPRLAEREKTSRYPMHHERVLRLIRAFFDEAAIHKRTSATHCSILMSGEEIVFRTEDISRHNAIDKAIGAMILMGLSPENCMLYTSGRVPEDAAEKVIKAGIPVFVSKAIPTSEAVHLAGKHGLTLICRAWTDHYEIITGEEWT